MYEIRINADNGNGFYVPLRSLMVRMMVLIMCTADIAGTIIREISERLKEDGFA